MGLQLERECAGANHVQVPGPVCRAEEVAYSQGGAVSVPQHVPVGEFGSCSTDRPTVCTLHDVLGLEVK